MVTKPERIRQLFHRQNISCSSDFVVALWQYYNLKNKDVNPVDPILRWEVTNTNESWSSNVLYIESKLHDLDESDYDEVYFAYINCLDFLLSEHLVSQIYPMDEKDITGWKLHKEFMEKRNAVQKYRMIARYNRSKGTENV